MTRPEVAEFIQAEIGRLTRFVRRRMEGVGAVEAEDVVQDVALRLFALPDVARPVENLAAYMFSSLQNRIADLWRRRRRRPEAGNMSGELESLAAPSAPGDAGGDPAALAERRERLRLLARAMEALPAEDRAVVTATEIEGRSFRELAEEWDTPIGTLLARKHRAMQKLRVL
ncbi:MAG: RNA polymerase sigma factor, partial [Candidatus Aminicenantes bacterium]|nr:RNA polymerase sigma factor [Candidatus Aminicenantes bacterium]